METIKNYLENMFQSLPKTEEILNLKNELLLNMEEKYSELKAEGKTENEAIGIVISEFGNIDELLNEMDINIKESNSDENLPSISLEEAEKYILVKKAASFLVGIGVALCILGSGVLILLTQLMDDKIIFNSFGKNAKDSIPVIFLLLFIAVAVGLFIYSGALLEKYRFIKNGDFYIDSATKSILSSKREKISLINKFAIIIGVCLCVLSPVAAIVGSTYGDRGANYGTVILLLIIAVAVFVFIRFGSENKAYKKLLMINGRYNSLNKENDRFIGAVSHMVFPLATCVFLLWGFLFHGWRICWIVFPITGILFSAFARTYKLMNSTNK